MCRALFGESWDKRYGRTRVRSATTGELLSWGDGVTIYDRQVSDASTLPQPAASSRAAGGSGQWLLGGEATAPPVAEDEPKPPPAMLRRGDTEVRLNAEAPKIVGGEYSTHFGSRLHGEARGEFPFFPPPRMHVAKTTGSLLAPAAPKPNSQLAGRLQCYPVERADTPHAAPQEEAEVTLPADFGASPDLVAAAAPAPADFYVAPTRQSSYREM